jgi:hypothetical protein
VKSIIFDENVPVMLKSALKGYQITSVQEEGWGGIKNGELILLINGQFDIFITADKNLRYQQNLTNRKIAIIELPCNSRRLVMPMAPRILAAAQLAQPNAYIELKAEPFEASIGPKD